MKDYSYSIAYDIKRAREERGFTQEELAELAGISHSHLSKVETGTRAIGMKTYVKILEALEVTPVLVSEVERTEKNTELLLRFICILKECQETELQFYLDIIESMKGSLSKINLVNNNNDDDDKVA